MKKTLIVVFALVLSKQIYAQTEFRKYANNYMYIGADARGRAMGNAVAASSEDTFASYWNPAGLTDINHEYTQIGYVHIFDGLYNYDVASIALPTKKDAVIGITALRYGVDDIPNTIFLVDQSGNINPENITTFSSADYGALLSYAKPLNDNISIGGSAKILHRSVGDFAKAWGAGIDLGLKYTSDDGYFKGAVFARDIFGTYASWDFQFDDPAVIAAFQRTGNDLPADGSIEATTPNLVLAGNYLFELGEFTILPEANLDITFDGKRNTLLSSSAFSIDPHAGVEFGYQNQIFLRGGINNIQEISQEDQLTTTKWEMQPSFGAGLKMNNIELDYALTQYDLREDLTHIIALKLSFN